MGDSGSDTTKDLTHTSAWERRQGAEERQLRPGDLLGGRFAIVRFIAAGGMGEVYEAKDRQLAGKHVALKTIRSDIAKSPEMLQRFQREVLLAREVTHRNVCPTYDLAQMNGPRGPVVFLTMKLLRGEPLSARLRRAGKLSDDLAMRIARQLADALDAAHRAGVIHRDFKPGNIMLEGLDDEIRVYVTDFGLSREYRSDETPVRADGVMGTPGYMAPELLMGEPASPASDVYAFGLVLRDMTEGEGWNEVVARCLVPDPARRCQSAGEALAPLERKSASGSVTAPPVSPAVPIPRRALIGIGLAGTAAAAGWLAWPAIDSLLASLFRPLPAKRFVALMAWPGEPDAQIRPVLHGVMDAIAASLSRAEATTKNLLVLRTTDGGGPEPKEPRQAVNLLGVNLVLAASLQAERDRWILALRVVEAARATVLRGKLLSLAGNELPLLPERAARAAAALLQVRAATSQTGNAELTQVSAAAWQAYAAAEELLAQPNDAGLDAAIAAYQKALEAEPGFALGYARIALAYMRKYQLFHAEASLRLAGMNADRAMKIDPEAPQSILSQALVSLYSGRTSEALAALERARKKDPGNSQILIYQARAFADLNQATEEEATYRRILTERPNFWPAYNELGGLQHRQGKIAEAAVSFEEASAVAPQVVRPLINAGSMYLLLNRRPEAEEAFRRSLQASPSELAYINLGNIAFEDRDWGKALTFYEKARDLNPRSHQIFRDIGDCYEAMGRSDQVRQNYTRAADLLARELETNPKPGRQWMRLAFYDAKAGRREKAEADLRTGDEHGATEVPAQFFKAQAEAVLGHRDEALRLVLQCLDRGMSTVDVDLALDLSAVRADARYKARVAALKSG